MATDVAARTAEHLGVDLFLQPMDEVNLAANFEDCIWHNEQPCYDLNTVGKFCLSHLVRSKGFKVVLTGEGSDEIFCGYPWHLPDILLEPDYSRPDLPLQQKQALREQVKAGIPDSHATFSRLAVGGLDPIDEELNKGLNKTFAPVGNNLMQPPRMLFKPSLANKYSLNDRLRMQMQEWPAEVQRKIREEWHPIHAGMYSWLKSILPNWAFSTVGDRGEMAHSVEARPPFTDHHLVELVNRIPPSFKQYYDEDTARFSEKWVLREACRPFITQELYDRKKQPYLAPARYQPGGAVHGLLKRLLTEERIERLGFVSWPVVDEMMSKAFSQESDSFAFKRCLNVAGWVVLGERFDVPKAEVE